MAVIELNGFRTQPGRLADHEAATAEALGHLRRLGLQAVVLQPLAGGDVGTIATSVNYANNADYAAAWARVMADEQWGEFWARAAAGGSAVQVETSLFSDIDTSFQPSTDRPLGVVLATQWRAKPGRMMDFMESAMTSVPHTTRMGGTTRVMQSVIGAHPMTTLITTTFADLDAYGEYADKLAGDEQWQAFWANAMSDPTADMVRSGLYVNASGD
jgi:hypothetical protein